MPLTASQYQQHQQQYQGAAEDQLDDAQLPQDLNGQILLQSQMRSMTAGAQLEGTYKGSDATGAPGDSIKASSGGTGRRRPMSAVPIKQTLFDFGPADPVHATVHYLRPSDQEGLRWVMLKLHVAAIG
jgi:hypothetical protein